MDADSMLTLNDLHFGYRGADVIHGFSTEIHSGEVTALLGINGAGKTTLVHGIMGFIPLRRGSVHIGGADISGLPSYEIARRGIALVPQGRRIFPSLSVLENLTIAVRTGPRPRWDIEAVLDFFPSLRDRLTNQGLGLSGGEQQMLAWGRALLTGPSVMLMDEPTEGLSPRIVRELQELIPRLSEEGLGILLVEQSIEFACSVADRVLVLVNGEIKREVSREEMDQVTARGDDMIDWLAYSVQGLTH